MFAAGLVASDCLELVREAERLNSSRHPLLKSSLSSSLCEGETFV